MCPLFLAKRTCVSTRRTHLSAVVNQNLFPKVTSLHCVNLSVLAPIFQTDSSIPSHSSQVTWSPRFFLQGINVHRKVGKKPDITRIFIKCNNWTLC